RQRTGIPPCQAIPPRPAGFPGPCLPTRRPVFCEAFRGRPGPEGVAGVAGQGLPDFVSACVPVRQCTEGACRAGPGGKGGASLLRAPSGGRARAFTALVSSHLARQTTMPPYTQTGRLLSVNTPLGDDVLLLAAFS